jgi:nucleotide-binding universal stress UspA family protein
MSNLVDGRPVVVGLDQSAPARLAVDVAAEEARQRGVPLRILHAFSWPWIWPPLGEEPESAVLPRAKARRLVERTVRQLREAHPDLVVSTRILDGHAATLLIDQSREAGLLVVGHRGSGGFAELLAGSVAMHTAAHASCPVLVVRGAPTKPDAPVVVGVDGSAGSRSAVLFAFATADRRGVPVVAVLVRPAHHGRDHPDGKEPWPGDGPLGDLLGAGPRWYPRAAVRPRIDRAGSPAAALVAASLDAGLIVVGARGRGGMTGLLLGSVGRALIDHAHCPVAVVRPAPHGTG